MENELKIVDYKEEDERIRKEFAKAFGWFEREGYYGDNKKARTPTWEEIFIETGKTLAARDFRDFEVELSVLQMKIERLETSTRT